MHAIAKIIQNKDFDEDWTFSKLNRREINRLTHSYHRYPSKFIPQIAARLIAEHSETGETILDPFMGSGTTLVEGLLLGRRVIGIDINPVAHLISKVKSTPIAPDILDNEYDKILTKLYDRRKSRKLMANISEAITTNLDVERMRYWFPDSSIKDLSMILSAIYETDRDDVRDFFLCAFSHILKNCSRWSMRSIKPTRDMHKKIPNPIEIFRKHVWHMIIKNHQFFDLIPTQVKEKMGDYVRIILGDCRIASQYCDDVSLIVTSPPYVTSYEYFSVHQLSIMWLFPNIRLSEYRKKFIGVKQKPLSSIELLSETGRRLVQRLYAKSYSSSINNYARAVQNYFIDMQESCTEFKRILKRDGKLCIVIGNTSYGGVTVSNAEVVAEVCAALGYRLETVIKRKVPISAKFLPSARDPRTGIFTSMQRKGRMAYPFEYILIFSNVS